MFPLFPTDSVAVSMTATIWVGVLVVVLGHTRFGWTLSGLVVPGYLVPLLIARPMSAVVICAEAAVTYAAVRLLSDGVRVRGAWSSFFGRDRFFVIVMVSVLVRVVADGWLLPLLGKTLATQYGWTIDYGKDLHSYGLLIVALIANYFWTPGLKRGVLPFAAVVGATYAIVRYLLAGYTNINLESLQFMYEDIASSLLASPKAYIVLVTAAYLASRFKLRYGWEYGGILIPALLALLWHDPWKLISTGVEATGIWILAGTVMHLLDHRGIAVNGPRKLALFFTVCFLYRLAVAHLSLALWPHRPATDAYGFGYLLTSLLALSAYDRGMPVRVLRATLQTSMLGAVAGSLIGFALLATPDVLPLGAPRAVSVESNRCGRVDGASIESILARAKVDLYRQPAHDHAAPPSAGELAQFKAALRRIAACRAPADAATLDEASARLASIGYELTLVGGRYLWLTERPPGQGRGIYVIDLEQQEGLLVEVPAPLEEWSTFEAGACLWRQLRGRALAIGAAGSRSRAGVSEVLRRRRSLFHAFHRLMGRRNALQVRGRRAHVVRGPSGGSGAGKDRGSHNVAWVKRGLPRSLSLTALKSQIGSCRVFWGAPRRVNVVREDSTAGFAELWLSASARHALRRRWRATSGQEGHPATVARWRGHLRGWLMGVKERIARPATDAYVPATEAELLYLDREIVQPLLDWVTQCRSTASGDRPSADDLALIDQAAAAVGYRLLVIDEPEAPSAYVALTEGPAERKYWGTYLFRLRGAEPYVVHIPRPLYERNAFEVGCWVFERTRAAELLIAGAHPYANRDGSSNLMRFANRASALNLVHQVIVRNARAASLVIIQARSIRAPVDADIVINSSRGMATPERASPLCRRLIERLRASRLRLRTVDGSMATAGYESGLPVPTTVVDQGERKEVVSLWVSPSLRGKYRDQETNRLLAAALAAAGIPNEPGDLGTRLRQAGAAAAASELPRRLREDLQAYLENLDVVQLCALKRVWADYEFRAVLDGASGQWFLLIGRPNGSIADLLNVSGWVGDVRAATVVDDADGRRIADFVHSRAPWLKIRTPRKISARADRSARRSASRRNEQRGGVGRPPHIWGKEIR